MDSARASCSTAADNCSPPPTSSTITFAPETHPALYQENMTAKSSTGERDNGIRSPTYQETMKDGVRNNTMYQDNTNSKETNARNNNIYQERDNAKDSARNNVMYQDNITSKETNARGNNMYQEREIAKDNVRTNVSMYQDSMSGKSDKDSGVRSSHSLYQESINTKSSSSDKDVRSSATSGIGSGSDPDTSVAGSSVGGSAEGKKERDERKPPPVPARVTACISEETVSRKVKRRSRRSSPPQPPQPPR